MWEDSKTRSMWVIASRCYFPADLPKGVGRPFAPDNNEVSLRDGSKKLLFDVLLL